MDIDYTVEYDIEGDKNRGWKIDSVVARYKGAEVGYLKMAYIPPDRFKDHYPTIFNYMDTMLGRLIIPRPSNASSDDYRDAAKRHYRTFDNIELRKFIHSVSNCMHTPVAADELEALCHTGLIERVKMLEARAQTQLGKDFKHFKTYYSKPIDDFVRTEFEYQRQGIAEHMYKVAVKYLESQNMSLYLSNIRMPAAECLAAKFREQGILRKMSNGREKFLSEKIEL